MSPKFLIPKLNSFSFTNMPTKFVNAYLIKKKKKLHYSLSIYLYHSYTTFRVLCIKVYKSARKINFSEIICNLPLNTAH